ncbi:hypothetical protein BO86DRAFT_201794 [Aspergillus japonicus CBS 114.51]|uniref:Uncharacterized protein n=1 Tax=Aspergillus japonicus CBS 114.51 TaxID=1448312 RepID=A0A8T8WQF1_ASPJA|nr:hypothetical protein BO86DRAFT_201794 [Aspergillus japonicus CBS 114.51]RAH77914.1 hypothetical protein BO86DRAFT_201794 [Aspergillus japonicus CBS 114.51]
MPSLEHHIWCRLWLVIRIIRETLSSLAVQSNPKGRIRVEWSDHSILLPNPAKRETRGVFVTNSIDEKKKWESFFLLLFCPDPRSWGKGKPPFVSCFFSSLSNKERQGSLVSRAPFPPSFAPPLCRASVRSTPTTLTSAAVIYSNLLILMGRRQIMRGGQQSDIDITVVPRIITASESGLTFLHVSPWFGHLARVVVRLRGVGWVSCSLVTHEQTQHSI